ncbi:MAG: lactate utilization protein, partial [SAR324 cluster bacterium]|nr:lactate utilization protein [SAR324 cluster bacterium]
VECKEILWSVAAGVTQTIGAIAETGSLLLKPDEQEPRLLSLVPPIHLAILDSKRIYSTFSEAIREEGWSRPMPTNVLLISGPSKTADIEQTLVYGIHGPKQLILFLIR